MTERTTPLKRGRKYDQVVDGARVVFLRDGFESAKVDDIAQEARVSKATLYSYFADKKVLFLEVAALEAMRQADAYHQDMDDSQPPEIILTSAGRKILDFVLSDFGQSMFRIAVAESQRFPEVGQRIYENGPALVRSRLAFYFEKCVNRGELEIEDLGFAAEQFAELCKVRAHMCCVFNACAIPDTAEREMIVNSAVQMFISHYGVKP